METPERLEKKFRSTEELSPCMSIAKTACEVAQERGVGGTVVISYDLEGSGENHVAFIPLLTPEEVETSSFEIIDSSPEGKLTALRFENLDDYQKYKKATGVETVGIGPSEDFAIKMVEATVNRVLAARF